MRSIQITRPAGREPAQVVVALDERHVRAEARRRDGGRHAGRAAADHEHVRLGEHRDVARRLVDRLRGPAAPGRPRARRRRSPGPAGERACRRCHSSSRVSPSLRIRARCPAWRPGRGARSGPRRRAPEVAPARRAHDVAAVVDDLTAQERRHHLAPELLALEGRVPLGRRRVGGPHREGPVRVEQDEVGIVARGDVALAAEAEAPRRVPGRGARPCGRGTCRAATPR